MAELVIEAVITVLVEKLASGDLIRLARSAEISSKLNKLAETLTQIQDVLVDARQKHIRERSVRTWISKLHHLAYQIDDVLDDLATEATRHRLNQEVYDSTSSTRSKVLKLLPTKFDDLKYHRKMSSKLDLIDGVTTKLNDLVNEIHVLNLVRGLTDVIVPVGGTQRSEESALIDKSKFIGRKGDQAVLVGMLSGSESSSNQVENVSVVSIVGLSGMGKTTLARLLYNDEKEKGHFQLLSWISLADEFNVSNISKAIFKDVGGNANGTFETLNQLQEALAEKLINKRFLIVLDNVWNEDDKKWESLKLPFIKGTPGSKVLVTTQSTEVAIVMDCPEPYTLRDLSKEDALSLFKQNAKSNLQTFDVDGMLELHGEDVVLKCGNLPLALKTVGRVFRKKATKEEWEELFKSEIWSLNGDKNILPALSVSYNYLPPHLKPLVGYCCLFPRQYMFSKDELVLLWMAEGFLNPIDKTKSMESFGEECFQELVSRLFFQHSTTDESLYTMHDRINDMATSVGGEFFSRVEPKMDVNSHNALERVHHVSFVREEYGPYKKFKALQRAIRLRTLLTMPVTWSTRSDTSYVSNQVLIEVLPQLQFLRVLSFAYYNIKEVPESIGNLKHIRYLNFSNTMITCLPEQIGNLLNLQSLLLSACHELSSLPNSITKLINLRHLDISDTPQLSKLPLAIGGLTSLRTLSKVIIGGLDNDFKISNLKGLKHLQGQLHIEGLHTVKNSVDAREASLEEKEGICDLRMKWSNIIDVSRNPTTEQKTLEGLRPFKKLRILEIQYYGGREFPSWVRNPSLVCLTKLVLLGCRSCTCLPTLGHLPLLQWLDVQSMPLLKKLGSEFLGESNSRNGVAFPSLEYLRFKDMDGCEEWSTKGGVKVGAFPRLVKITFINCPKLDDVALDSIPSLRTLYVDGCSLMLLRSMVGVSPSVAALVIKNIRGFTQLRREDLEHLKAVEQLEIHNCDEVTDLWGSETEAYECLGSLRVLFVCDCANLVSLGYEEVHCMKSVTTVDIRNCPKLSFPTMDDIHIPSTLKNLPTEQCDNPEVSTFSSLKYLYIKGVQNLWRFPEVSLHRLVELWIENCDNIESIPDDGYGLLPFPCLNYLKVVNCENLKSFPHRQLESLTSLKIMVIVGCPSLDESFPCDSWPPNLTSLHIGRLKKPISEWGLQNFPTSLVELVLWGYSSGVVSFAAKAKEEETSTSSSSSSFALPPSLTSLEIIDFEELESVSEGLQHLTCLEELYITKCPKIRDLPETLLPLLSFLWLDPVPSKLKKKCRPRKGKYWPLISQIPRLELEYD